MSSGSLIERKFLLGIFVLLALLAQGVIPAGYMPRFQTGHVFEISICHGADIATLFVDEHMKPIKKNPVLPAEKEKSVKPCAYASLSTKHFSMPAVLLQKIVYLTYERYVVRDTQAHFISALPRAYFGQGPPHSLVR